jgi:Glycosidases
VLSQYLKDENPDYFSRIVRNVNSDKNISDVLVFYSNNFPSPLFEAQHADQYQTELENLRGYFIHQVLLANPALVKAAGPLIAPDGLVFPKTAKALSSLIGSYINDNGSDDDIFMLLTKPARLFPNSLKDQISYIIREWNTLIPAEFISMLNSAIDVINEEEKDHGFGFVGKPETRIPDYSAEENEYEAFSADTDWMPKVVMIAKCTLVWLDQLSKWYKKDITRLDQIPDHELDLLRERGFNALWLIGLWERSKASKTIKNLCGNPDAEASAYSLKDYEIAANIGGWDALENLRKRCDERGIRLASDMVPNHTGIDGTWVFEHPEYFISEDYPPFPSYTFNGPDLSKDPNVEIKLEDHYYDRTDAAVTFRWRNRHTGETKYIFHGNDGTTMPWNDTAQIDYLNPEAREAVIQKILHVARNFRIIRFDAAMTLAKRHIQRLWYPKPGHGGDIAGRAIHALSEQEFNARIPQEFWREVVDRVALEVPDTLLLAEAFWMMEGYFVRTLGMHRVYNSAFMNMLKNQENGKYRTAIKNTLVFEPEILKRYVNFMNNPDEETAIAQFGDGFRYFSICTILATLPGLPMFGHGQIEGFREKYGMEYKRAYWNEKPNDWIVEEHYRRIFPLLKKRYLFSGVEHFNIYDAYGQNGNVEESVFAYANGTDAEKTLVLVNNRYERVQARIKYSAPKLKKNGEESSQVTISIADNLGLSFGGRRYVIWENFSTGMTHIMPSIKFFEEGFEFALEGYESMVLWNIREVEDIDGNFEKLYKMLGSNGIKDISRAIALLRLKPLYKLIDNFRSESFIREITAIVKGKATAQMEKSVLLTIAECYVKLIEGFDALPSPLRAQLAVRPREIEAKEMIGAIKTIATLFSKEAKTGLFANWAATEESLPLIVAASIILEPFVDKKRTALSAATTGDRLLLDSFLENWGKEAGCTPDEVRTAVHAGALLATAGIAKKTKEADECVSVLEAVLADKVALDYVNANEYQGVTWYNKESMQSLILITALSLAIMSPRRAVFDPEKFVSTLFDKEAAAEYKLASLLKKDEE